MNFTQLYEKIEAMAVESLMQGINPKCFTVYVGKETIDPSYADDIVLWPNQYMTSYGVVFLKWVEGSDISFSPPGYASKATEVSQVKSEMKEALDAMRAFIGEG